MDKEDVVHTYNGILLRHEKEWNICSNMMNLEIIILIEVNPTKATYDITYMWNLSKIIQKTYIWNKNRPTDIENKLMVTKWKRAEGGIN